VKAAAYQSVQVYHRQVKAVPCWYQAVWDQSAAMFVSQAAQDQQELEAQYISRQVKAQGHHHQAAQC
jgi:hypothetical protein